ncbi:MAG: DUF1800 domain-containing protein [Burkholderiales bacterium]|nr:DUF1800 domain-containing protein [Burkholderiales bacterium]
MIKLHSILLGIVLLGAGAALAQAQNREIGADGARHLLNRTGFAASPADIDQFAKLTRAEAADRLLRSARREPVTPPPAWVDEAILPPYKLRDLSPEERMKENRLNIERGIELREWWFRELLDTPSPLTEKMTIFWHNHFATSQQKVRYGQLMYRQNLTLRKHALGNFGQLLKDIARDPAMVVYLDSAQNRRGQPNENFAREVMELFTLGEGQYSENDIKEVARAFTGWSIDRDNGEFMFRRMAHDGGVKTVFGRTGRFDGNDVLDILLDRPQTAEFITTKLWKEFVSPTPDMEEVHRLARIFRNSRYDISVLMRAMLTSDAFYARENRATLVKSPVEFVVGTLKQFDIQTQYLRPFVFAAAGLGQNLMSPPNVKGWPGGDTWINSSSLLGRKQFLDRVFRANDMPLPPVPGDMVAMMRGAAGDIERGEQPRRPPPGRGDSGRQERREQLMQRALENDRGRAGLRMDLPRWTGQFKTRDGDALTAMASVVLPMTPQNPIQPVMMADRSQEALAQVRQLVSDPTYQLK